MPVIEVEGKKIELDEDNFLVNFEDWDENVACTLADREGVSKTCPLTENKMEVLKFIREYYKKLNAFPIPSAVCRNLHKPSQCVVERFIEPVKAWKIAGLPRPSDFVVEYIKKECS